MRLIDYLDKGASLGPDKPCLTMGDIDISYRQVQQLTYKIARFLHRNNMGAGAKIAVLAGNDPVAFACVFAISRAGAIWCPINPRNEAAENRQLLDGFDCTCLIFQNAYAPLVEKIKGDLPQLTLLICLDASLPYAASLDECLRTLDDALIEIAPADDIAMIAGTGGTTGQPKGVMLSGRNLEAMSAITLMSYPFAGRPVYLALAPLTHAAGVLCLPIMALGGRVVIMPKPDLSMFLQL
ncbi:MAG TPA: AMP-binding protein, partial [Acetobacteraceae bacterium]|nr:AMP-binding protein [Acetobacteraceae bacterium]